jgi:rod shape-determining protein MreD
MMVICAGFIQLAAFGYIEIAGIKPDILLLIVIFISLSCQKPETIKAALAAGIIKDVASSSVFGSYMLSFLVLGLFLNYHQRKFYKERILTQALFGFCSYIFMAIFVFGLNSIAHRSLGLFYMFLNITVKGAFYTAVVSPLVFFAASKILRIRFAQIL